MSEIETRELICIGCPLGCPLTSRNERHRSSICDWKHLSKWRPLCQEGSNRSKADSDQYCKSAGR